MLAYFVGGPKDGETSFEIQRTSVIYVPVVRNIAFGGDDETVTSIDEIQYRLFQRLEYEDAAIYVVEGHELWDE